MPLTTRRAAVKNPLLARTLGSLRSIKYRVATYELHQFRHHPDPTSPAEKHIAKPGPCLYVDGAIDAKSADCRIGSRQLTEATLLKPTFTPRGTPAPVSGSRLKRRYRGS
jgi:hypothetical protein